MTTSRSRREEPWKARSRGLVRPVSGGSTRGGWCSVCEDAAVPGGAIPLERSSPTVRMEREPIRDPWGRVPHPGSQPMGQGFQESSRRVVQGGSDSVLSLVWGLPSASSGAVPLGRMSILSFRSPARRATRTHRRYSSRTCSALCLRGRSRSRRKNRRAGSTLRRIPPAADTIDDTWRPRRSRRAFGPYGCLYISR